MITTSDAFPHCGGIRANAAQEVPINALDLNRPILERGLPAPPKRRPDAL